jgi:hypothetical protein
LITHWNPSKLCKKHARKVYFSAHKEYYANHQRQWRKKHPDQAKLLKRRSVVKIKYGLTDDALNKILSEQDNKCAVCKKELRGLRLNQKAIDHDHKTGKVRGYLCMYCNTGMGWVDRVSIDKVLKYLEESK